MKNTVFPHHNNMNEAEEFFRKTCHIMTQRQHSIWRRWVFITAKLHKMFNCFEVSITTCCYLPTYQLCFLFWMSLSSFYNSHEFLDTPCWSFPASFFISVHVQHDAQLVKTQPSHSGVSNITAAEHWLTSSCGMIILDLLWTKVWSISNILPCDGVCFCTSRLPVLMFSVTLQTPFSFLSLFMPVTF